MVPRINALAELCRRLEITVIWVRTVHLKDVLLNSVRSAFRKAAIDLSNKMENLEGYMGSDFVEGLDISGGDFIVTKRKYSAFIQGSSDIEHLLRPKGIDTVVITGVATNVCCESTARDAMMLDYKVFFISDLNMTSDEEAQWASLKALERNFARVLSYEELLSELKA